MWLYNPFVSLTFILSPTFSTYRALRCIDKQAFCRDILLLWLYGSQQSDADEYADLFDAEVTRVLEIHAPLRTCRRRCR